VVLFGFPLVVHAEQRYWLFLSLEVGGYVAAFFNGGGLYCSSWQAPWWRCGRGVGKDLSSRRRCGWFVGWALLALMVVATATPEAVPEIAREAGVSVEEARVLYRALLFGAAVGVGFAMFVAWLLAALLWWFLEWWLLEVGSICRGLLLLVTPGFLAAVVFLALAFFQAEPKDVALDRGGRPRHLAGVPKAERKMDTPALMYTCGRGQG
jgi:hypothetical protein